MTQGKFKMSCCYSFSNCLTSKEIFNSRKEINNDYILGLVKGTSKISLSYLFILLMSNI